VTEKEREVIVNKYLTPDNPIYIQVIQRERRVDMVKVLLLVGAALIIVMLTV
jgi:hypothetical protein